MITADNVEIVWGLVFLGYALFLLSHLGVDDDG
jgi:hypothetical protein